MNYKTYEYNNKEIRIYEWNNKPPSDFQIPEGFKFINFNEFNKLIEKEIIKLDVWKSYLVNHWNKQMRKRGIISRVCLVSLGSLFSSNCSLDYSYASGGIVVIK